MGTVIKKEFLTVEQIFKFVDERLDKNSFYPFGIEEGASKSDAIDKMVEITEIREFPDEVLTCVFNGYPLPSIVICRARLFPNGRFRADIGEDVWALCSGELLLGTLYAYREGLTCSWYENEDGEFHDEDEVSWWDGASYQTLVEEASMGDKKSREMLDAFNKCEIPFIRILEIDDKEYLREIDEVLEDCSD